MEYAEYRVRIDHFKPGGMVKILTAKGIVGHRIYPEYPKCQQQPKIGSVPNRSSRHRQRMMVAGCMAQGSHVLSGLAQGTAQNGIKARCYCTGRKSEFRIAKASKALYQARISFRCWRSVILAQFIESQG